MSLQPVLTCAFVTVSLIVVALMVFASKYRPYGLKTGAWIGDGEKDRVLEFWLGVGTALFAVSGIACARSRPPSGKALDR